VGTALYRKYSDEVYMPNIEERELELLHSIVRITQELSDYIAKYGEHYRICTKCLKVKSLSDFYASRGIRKAECKVCFGERSRQYSQTEAGKTNRNTAAVRRWKDPAKLDSRRAHNRITKLVLRGKLPPASSLQCVSCNGPADHYHHHRGYDEEHREDVVPVCRTCHAKEHYPTA